MKLSVPTKSIFKTVLFFFLGLEICTVCILIFFIVFHSQIKILTILSDSMLPQIKAGDHVLVWKSELLPEEISGKVIAFYDPSKGSIMVHRAIDYRNGLYTTKGDNADLPDFFKPDKNYIFGKIIYIF